MAPGWLERKAPALHKFLTRRDRPWPLVREALAFLLVVGLLFGALYGLTGQPVRGGYPVVVVTTGSMMHCDNYPNSQLGSNCDPANWGRLGAIDPGDLVFVKRVTDAADITTRADDEDSHYGRAGDVIVYRRNGDPGQTPVIHRALFWVQVNDDGTYSVPSLGLDRVTRIDSPRVRELTSDSGGCDVTAAFARQAQDPPGPASQLSGFVTRGDNNAVADQCGAWLPARLPWVLGKARAEVPWIGLVNLWWNDLRLGSNDFGNAGSDSKVMFFVVVAFLVAAPWLIEVAWRRRRRRKDST